MRELSRIITGIAPSATLEISEKARQMQRQGFDVISLSIGEPDFDTPAHIKEACIQALIRGETHYAPSNGIPELLSAISTKTDRENKIPCTTRQVIVTCGAKDAIYDAMVAVLNPGDEVIILDPSWVSYEPCVRMAGGKPVHHPLNTRTFQVDESILEKITAKTRMIVINSPSNPSGAILTRPSLGLIADLCEDYDLFSLSDEIYEKLIYGKDHISLASIRDMAERTITVNGFSKAYAMTGWRLGWAVAPTVIINQMSKVQQHSISHPTTFAMYGGVAALTSDQSCVDTMRKEFNRRRDFLVQELLLMGYPVAPAEGAFYAFVNTGGDDIETARIWLEKGLVAVTPGSAFNTPGWQRISYATSMECLQEAVRRIKNLT
ncbi:MAG: pyridoxal phosphate-dependent aminotransferase [Methanoregulaceae archaeon]|jgi:aspartate aminotransferase|nr:pyridoxal phosphate-dependent aminotransferase [Methanoregulaceae archaeon]